MGNKYKSKSKAQAACELLDEAAQICEANDIEYFLARTLVKRAIDGLDYDRFFLLPAVFMTVDNVVRFIETVEKSGREGRSLDYLGNNSEYIGFNVSYVNTDTTYIDIARGLDFSKYGISVVIHVLRDDIKNRIPAFVETGVDENSNLVDISGKGNWKKKAVEKGISSAKTVIGKNFNKKLFDYYVKQFSSDPGSKRVFVKTFKARRRYFDRDIFREKSKLDFNGRSYTVPKDIDAYLEGYYGTNAKNAEIREFRINSALISTVIPYEEYLASMKEAGIPIESLFEQNNEVRESIAANRDVVEAVNKVNDTARMSEDRMRLYKELHPRMDEIRRLHAEGDYDKLTEIFTEYNDLARYYVNWDLTLCPDEELFDILCDIMERRGATGRVAKMRKNLAEHHKRPLIGRSGQQGQYGDSK